MTHPVVPAPTLISTPAGTRSRASRLRLLQAGWVGYAGLVAVVTLAGLPAFYDQLQRVCDGPDCASFLQLSTPNAQALQAAGFSLLTYAGYNLLTRGVILPLVTFGLAALLIWRRPADRVAALFAFVLVAFSALNAQGIAVLAAQSPGLRWLDQGIRLIQGAGFVPLFCLFPNGRWVPSWSKWVAAGFVAINLLNLMPGLQLSGGLEIGVVGSAYLFVPAVQLYRYRRVSTWAQRQQTKWVVWAWGLFALPLLLLPVWLVWAPAVLQLGTLPNLAINVYAFWSLLFVQVAFVISILRFQLFDIDRVINRTLVYVALSLGLAGAYLAVVVGLGSLFRPQTSLLLPLLATGLAAAAFQPLRDRLQRGVNRLMYGQRDEPYVVLTRLGQQLEVAIEPAAALTLIVEAVAQALKLPYVAIGLGPAGALRTAAAYGRAPEQLEPFPLVYAGDHLGELVVAARAPAEPLAPADRRLLGDLARHIAVMAHAQLLAANLEQARLQMVTAQEETRRRLGSDLHDGVGHQIAGLVRRVELAANLLPQDPAQAGTLLAEVKGQLNAALDQVRGLAYQLHPPELELLGLAGALRERAQIHTGLALRIEAPDTLPRLPSAVETAAYYIALAALANVEQHASAQACLVRLGFTTGEIGETDLLELEVTDDGLGLPAPSDRASGLGLLSMQARAAEVGGVCRFEARSGGGTRVVVRLPYSVSSV